jgi:hypothetical protein
MWAFHPDNASKAAWRDMRKELGALIAAAADANIVLGIEPEPGNIVRDAAAAQRLYAELGLDAPVVGIVADSANLLAGVPTDLHHRVLDQSFKALAERIICLDARRRRTRRLPTCGSPVPRPGPDRSDHRAGRGARTGCRCEGLHRTHLLNSALDTGQRCGLCDPPFLAARWVVGSSRRLGARRLDRGVTLDR